MLLSVSLMPESSVMMMFVSPVGVTLVWQRLKRCPQADSLRALLPTATALKLSIAATRRVCPARRRLSPSTSCGTNPDF